MSFLLEFICYSNIGLFETIPVPPTVFVVLQSSLQGTLGLFADFPKIVGLCLLKSLLSLVYESIQMEL